MLHTYTRSVLRSQTGYQLKLPAVRLRPTTGNALTGAFSTERAAAFSILRHRRKLACFTAWISNTNSPPLQVAETTIQQLMGGFFNNKNHLSLTAKSESDTSYANPRVRCPWSLVRRQLTAFAAKRRAPNG